ncbi:threonine/serine dehydratase [Janibacter cremeus]|uniref:threonine ammonia-lyase n=1 Tax=Janibacter cremeus TaxID=1285192 RepID=UPI0023F81393|nr:threonine/serine dehydratase [Janibacter cremeus]WEV77190.1 threonine/serine dehydratase [Janibacter cremeus]
MDFGIETIRDAARRIEGQVRVTPLLSSPVLDELTGARVLVKAESLQLTGSFKIRGALNTLRSLTDAERSAGVLAFSTGNHGQAVAASARMTGARATVVMPQDAPRVKVEGVRWWGGEVVFYDPATQDREEVGRGLVEERGLTLVHPYDDVRVMSGQGTVGLEIVDQLREGGHSPDAVVVPCSGGGLSSGVFEAVRDAHPGATPFVVERDGYPKMARSLASGRVEKVPAVPVFLDAIGSPTVGRHTLAALSRHPVDPLTVTDDEAGVAMREAFRTLKLVVEPGGSAALAAVLAHRERFAGRTVVLVASGGNVDASVYAEVLGEG